MALYETAEEVREAIIGAFDQQTGRGDFLRKMLLVGAGVAAGSAVLAQGAVPALAAQMEPGRTHAGIPHSDFQILNYALTLEHLEATFYRTARRPSNPQIARYIDVVAAHEKTHVDALTAVIENAGGTAAREATYTFPSFSLPFAIVLENTGVHAYLGAAPLVKSSALLLTAASIVTVEARHAAAWMTLNKQNPTLGAFDTGLSMAAVVTAVTPLFAK